MSYWITAAIVIGGSLAQQYNTHETAKKQDNQLAAQLRREQMHDQEATQQVNQLIGKRAQSTDSDEKAQSLGKYMQALRSASGNATRPLNQAGAVSDAYTQDANNAALGVSQYGANQANMLASIDAPLLQRQAESANNLRFGTALNAIERRAQGDDFLSQLRLSEIRRNPWIDLVGNAAMGYAAARGAAAGGTKKLPKSAGVWNRTVNNGTNGIVSLPAGSYFGNPGAV